MAERCLSEYTTSDIPEGSPPGMSLGCRQVGVLGMLVEAPTCRGIRGVVFSSRSKTRGATGHLGVRITFPAPTCLQASWGAPACTPLLTPLQQSIISVSVAVAGDAPAGGVPSGPVGAPWCVRPPASGGHPGDEVLAGKTPFPPGGSHSARGAGRRASGLARLAAYRVRLSSAS